MTEENKSEVEPCPPGCSYSRYNSTLGVVCEYILCTGKMRPCPAGAKCTVFTTARIPRDEERWTDNTVRKWIKKGNQGEADSSLPG